MRIVLLTWLKHYKLTSVFFPAELSSTLMEKMQAQEMISGLRIPEMDDISQFFLSLPTSTLVGIGALTAVLTYWLATRPRPIKPPCSLQHQSEEVPVNWSRVLLLYCLLLLYWNSILESICELLHKHMKNINNCISLSLHFQLLFDLDV